MNKIRKVTFKNHPILGNLSLNFCDNKEAVDTIIFAGENGTGKSTILNCLYEAVTDHFFIDMKLEMEKGPDVSDIVVCTTEQSGYNYHMKATNLFGKKVPIEIFQGIFSDVDINFHSTPINVVTSENVDMQGNSRRSDANLTKQIHQLIIDIQALDDADLSKVFREAKENGLDTNSITFSDRMSRFKKAFSTMFDTLTYDRVDNIRGHKSIIFKKNGEDIPIDALSSGEKQIIYRGGFLLKDLGALNGAFVFIDEPEISLHPNWQKKIMDYYKGIFTDENGVQTSQIFAVTHSPFIIHNENRRNDKVIVLARDEHGNIVVKDKPEYYKCESLELVQDAFSIKDFSVGQSTVYLEGRMDEKYFKRALEVFGYKDIPFEFKWIGYLDDNGQEVNTGKDALNRAVQFLIARNLPHKNVCLFDCDTKRESSEKNNVFTRVVDGHTNTKNMKKGIENALVLDNIDTQSFYKRTVKPGDYGDDNVITEFQKMAFCEYICSLDDSILQSVFANLKIKIDKLIELFKES